MSCDDTHWMRQALLQAQQAFDAGEVPVGAVLIRDNTVLAASHNAPISEHDPTAHAEIRVLRAAGALLQNYRLRGCTLYVTLEPCAMCAMALLHARVDRVVFGANDPKTGACGSVVNLFALRQLNHQTQIESGILAGACSDLLKQFFSQRREKKIFPLREDALRTPEERFSAAGVSADSFYTNSLPSLAGLRLHYRFETDQDNGKTRYQEGGQKLILCLHELDSYSEQLMSVLSELSAAGYAVLAPDLIGFGRSDKLKKIRSHSLAFHGAYLAELIISHLEPSHKVSCIDSQTKIVILAAQSSIGLVDELVAQLSQYHFSPEAVCLVEDFPQLRQSQQQAPFPDAGHRSALRFFTTKEHVVPNRQDKNAYYLFQTLSVKHLTHFLHSLFFNL